MRCKQQVKALLPYLLVALVPVVFLCLNVWEACNGPPPGTCGCVTAYFLILDEAKDKAVYFGTFLIALELGLYFSHRNAWLWKRRKLVAQAIFYVPFLVFIGTSALFSHAGWTRLWQSDYLDIVLYGI